MEVEASARARKVSVVVCVHNGARDLPALFSALREQTLPRDEFEVIVVDDASTDETAALAEQEPGTRLIRAPEKVGLPRARNIGIAEAVAPIVAMTDADTCPAPPWLELGVRRMEEDGADMLAGAVRVPLGTRPTIPALLDAATHFDQESYVERGYGVGANLWVRRSLVDRIGGFNEQLEAYGGDDNEFGQRATQAGAKLIFAPEVELSHPPRTTVKSLVRKGYLLGFGRAAHRRHNPGPVGTVPPLYTQRHQFTPRWRMLKVERLVNAGYVPSRFQLARLQLGRYLFVQLPRVYGDLRGELAYRKGHGGGS